MVRRVEIRTGGSGGGAVAVEDDAPAFARVGLPPIDRGGGPEVHFGAEADNERSSRLHRQQQQSPPRTTKSPRSVGPLQEQAAGPRTRHRERESPRWESKGSERE